MFSRAIATALLAACSTWLTCSALAAGNANPGIVPPQASPSGSTYGEWAAMWWQWALGIPPETNPLLDSTGEFCDIGQNGHVWFLAGNFGGVSVRECIIPAGKALFFPIINNFWVTTCVGEPRTIADMRPFVAPFVDAATGLAVQINGVPVKGLEQYRAESPLFCTQLALFGINTVEDMLNSGFCGSPEDYNLNCGDLPNPAEHFGTFDGFGPSMADGYWLMLAPLSAGEHTIHITAASGDFSLDVTYYLTVQ